MTGSVITFSVAFRAFARTGSVPISGAGRMRLLVRYGPEWHLAHPAFSKTFRPRWAVSVSILIGGAGGVSVFCQADMALTCSQTRLPGELIQRPSGETR